MPTYQDPEMSYRRGYHDGAWELFQSIRHLLPAADRERALAWIQQDIRHWRVDEIVTPGHAEARRAGR